MRKLAEVIEPRYRMLVQLAVFGSLRWGELMGPRKSDFDLTASTVRISRAVSEVGSQLSIKEPKTTAGNRLVSLPASLVPAIRDHLERYAEAGLDGRVFVGPQGGCDPAAWQLLEGVEARPGGRRPRWVPRSRPAAHGQPPELDHGGAPAS